MTDAAPGSWILSIDDDPDVSALIRLLLRQAGYRVSSFLNGLEAIKELEAGHLQPDLILLDVEMPEIDGYATCQRLQANPVWSLIPVVFLTGSGSPTNRLRAFQLGAVGFLDKTIAPEFLLVEIKKFLQIRQSWLSIFHTPEPAPESPIPLSGFAGFRAYLEQQTGKLLGRSIPPARLYGKAAAVGLSAPQLAKAIATYCGLEYVDILDAGKVKLGVLPLPFCRKHQVVPIYDGAESAAVLSNPFDIELADTLERFGFKRRFVAEPAKIQALCSGQSIIRDQECVWNPISQRRP
ncbi:MAG: response regulator [Candidatus Sericytochromatia bacterium]